MPGISTGYGSQPTPEASSAIGDILRLVEFLCALVALLNTVAMAALPILGAVALVKWIFL